ncbi:MAG: alpha/beta hydrolase [Alphaproteobacteria bacterium]|nr:alpha/beta hydrolase [Alphaproteobacteria bacterium]MCB9795991.1 alpha/beta hydrolase [Alphaproteobacteria bacterium]
MSTIVDSLSLMQLRGQGFTSRWHSTRLGNVHALEGEGQGELPTLVMLHGVGSRCTHYRGLVKRLRPHFSRLLLPDLLGHGLSEVPPTGLSVDGLAEALTEALDALAPEPFVLFGNSLGGMMAMRYAAKRPEKVRALAVNSPAGAAVTEEQLEVLIDRFDVRSHDKSVQLVQRAFATPLPAPAQHAVALLVRRQLEPPHINHLLRNVRRGDILAPEELQRLRMPTLFTWGRRERVLLEEQLQYFLEHLPPHVQVKHPEHFGHSPYLERPTELAEHIVSIAREALDRPEPDAAPVEGAAK